MRQKPLEDVALQCEFGIIFNKNFLKNLSNFRISTVQKDAKFLLEFKERYQIKIRFPIKHHHVKELTLQYYDLVSTNNNARLKIHAKDANCSIMEVDFERVHDTKNGFFHYIKFNLVSKN